MLNDEKKLPLLTLTGLKTNSFPESIKADQHRIKPYLAHTLMLCAGLEYFWFIIFNGKVRVCFVSSRDFKVLSI